MMGPLQALESVPDLPMGGSLSAPPAQAPHFLAPGCGWSLCPDLFTCLCISLCEQIYPFKRKENGLEEEKQI